MTNVIAHRGASHDRPANTIAAFREAGVAGADAVELDVRLTRDDHVVVVHDAVLPDGRRVAATARRELPPGIPELQDALVACEGMWVNVELKADDTGPASEFVDAVLARIVGRPAGQRLLFSSFSPELSETCRQRIAGAEAAAARTALLCTHADDDTRRRCADAGHEAIHPHAGSLTRWEVERCHELGLAVNVWTCNDHARLAELVRWGVDGICTDVPAALVALLRSRAGATGSAS